MADLVFCFYSGNKGVEGVVILPVINQVDAQHLRLVGGDVGFDGFVAQVFHIALYNGRLITFFKQNGGQIAAVQAGGQGGVGNVILTVLAGCSGMFE